MFGEHRLRTIVVLALLVGGCVAPTTRQQTIDPELAARRAEKQRDLAIADYMTNQARIDNAGFRMLRAGVELCGERLRTAYGFRLLSALDFEGDYYEAYRRLNNDSDQVHVVAVFEDSPAAADGLAVSDIVLAIDGEPVAGEKGALGKMLAALREDDTRETATLTVLRPGEGERDIAITGEPICDYDLHLELNNSVNAYADGDNVVIYSGMARFTANDAQLAAIVGHEIAHNAMGHIDAKSANAMAGAGVGLIF